MKLSNYYYYFKDALSKDWCNRVMNLGLSATKEKAKVYDANLKNIFGKNRDCDVSWLDQKFIFDDLRPYINYANHNAEWNFEWHTFEKTQFTIYNKDHFFDWHTDSVTDRIKQHKDKTIVNKQRKLSLTILLNDKNEYEGGELEFDFKNRPENNIVVCNEIKTQGSIVIFPSFVWHRVKPIISGTRYSLVVWTLGEPWK